MGLVRILSSVVLLFLAVFLNQTYKEFAVNMDINGIFIIGTLLGFLYFLFGIVMELERLIEVIKKRTYKLNWGKFMTFFILISLLSIPIQNWVMWFGVGFPLPYIPFIYPEIKAILTVFSGILLVRSFEKIKV